MLKNTLIDKFDMSESEKAQCDALHAFFPVSCFYGIDRHHLLSLPHQQYLQHHWGCMNLEIFNLKSIIDSKRPQRYNVHKKIGVKGTYQGKYEGFFLLHIWWMPLFPLTKTKKKDSHCASKQIQLNVWCIYKCMYGQC